MQLTKRARLGRWLPALAATLALARPAGAALADCEGTLTPSNPTNRIVELRIPLPTGTESVCIELLDDQAPLTTANFVSYLEVGAIDGTIFHRVISNFVAQAGGYRIGTTNGRFEEIPSGAAVPNEPCTRDTPSPNGLICSQRGNVRGTLAMAKLGGDPNSATNEWFVNLVDNRGNLDIQNGGFTVFARVLGNGMTVLDQIAAFPRLPYDQKFGYTIASNPRNLIQLFEPNQYPTVILTDLRIQAALSDAPGAFGCFDVDELAVPHSSTAVNPQVGAVADASEFKGFLTLSAACGTQLANPAEFTGTPATNKDCAPADDFFAWGVVDQGAGEAGLNYASPLTPYGFTCAEVQASLAGLEQRRAAGMAGLVRVESATLVPEPSAALLGGVSLAALAALARRRARRS